MAGDDKTLNEASAARVVVYVRSGGPAAVAPL
jgi:hypothetical protein